MKFCKFLIDGERLLLVVVGVVGVFPDKPLDFSDTSFCSIT